MSGVDPDGWRPDPTGRHELRYVAGGVWTDAVSDGGVEGRDPPSAPATPPERTGPALAAGDRARPGSTVVAVTVVVVAAVGLAAAGFLLGRSLTGPDPIVRNDRAAVDRQKVVEILADGLYENLEGAITQDEADCAGREAVTALGPQRFIDLGLGGINPYGGFSFAELTADEEQTYMSAFLGCIPDSRLAEFVHSESIKLNEG